MAMTTITIIDHPNQPPTVHFITEPPLPEIVGAPLTTTQELSLVLRDAVHKFIRDKQLSYRPVDPNQRGKKL